MGNFDESIAREDREARLRPDNDFDLERFLRTTTAPRRFAPLDLADFDRAGNEDALEWVEALGVVLAAEGLLVGRRDLSLAFVGGFGTGKTRLAVWLLRRAWEGDLGTRNSAIQFPRFFAASALGDLRFRSHSAPEDEEDSRSRDRDALERCPLVVIDDVGRLAGYKGEERFLEAVVEKRHDALLSTILTANELPKEGRFADFLRYFTKIPLVGLTHRSEG